MEIRSKTTLLIASLLIATFLFSSSKVEAYDASDLGGPISVSAGGSVDNMWPDLKNGDFSDGRFWISVDANISENIRAYLGGFIYRRLRANGSSVDISKVTVGEFIDEAYIEIRNIGGKPVAFIVGKQYIPFGIDNKEMPNFQADPTYWNITETSGVFGFTVNLENIPFFDLVEISGFETGGYDLEVGTVDGASIRLSKQLTDSIKATGSYMHLANDDVLAEMEDRIALGFIFERGVWTTWVEGMHVSGNQAFPDMDFGIVIGAARKLGRGRMIVQGTYLTDTLKQVGFGYKMPVAPNVTVGAEARYTDYTYGEDGWSVTVRTTVHFSDIFRSKKRKKSKTEEVEEAPEEEDLD
ncbi:hypothetical protein N9W79_00285 [bacterium]|nr:hypothetical protein [bacterium]